MIWKLNLHYIKENSYQAVPLWTDMTEVDLDLIAGSPEDCARTVHWGEKLCHRYRLMIPEQAMKPRNSNDFLSLYNVDIIISKLCNLHLSHDYSE